MQLTDGIELLLLESNNADGDFASPELLVHQHVIRN